MREIELVSAATALFGYDQTSLHEPLYTDGANRLGAEFDFSAVESTSLPENGVRIWVAREGRGASPRADARTRIIGAHGNSQRLGVEVLGSTAKATEALEAIWRFLAGPTSATAASLSAIELRTTAVVEMPEAFEDFLPFAGMLEREYRQRLEVAYDRAPYRVFPRFTLEFTTPLGRGSASRSITFEPRASVSVDRKVLFTQSALPSEEHLALLRSLSRGHARRDS